MSQVGEGVNNTYKERAQKFGDILWHVKIKGHNEVTKDVPLHMSLKVFEDKNDMDMEEIKEKVKKLNITKPDPKRLKFKTTIFTSEKDDVKYYMLLVEGTDDSYKKFYDDMKHCGTVYKKFMPHITIDKALYDKINEEGLKPEEVEFENLMISHGAGNIVHEFNKSENIDLIRDSAFFVEGLSGSLVLSLPDNLFKNWLEDNPNYKKEILAKHEGRAKIHFGENMALYSYALQHTIKDTYKLSRKK